MARRNKGSSPSAYKRKVARRQRRSLPKSAIEGYLWTKTVRHVSSSDHQACAQLLIQRFDSVPHLSSEDHSKDHWGNLGSMAKLLTDPEVVIFTLKREWRHDVVASINHYAQSKALGSLWRDWDASEAAEKRRKNQSDALWTWANKIKYAALTIEERALRLAEWAAAPDKPLGHRPPYANHFPPTVMPTLLELLEGRPSDVFTWLNEHGHDETIRVVIDTIEGDVDLEELDARINNPRAYLGWGALPHIPISIRSGDQSRMGIMRPFMLAAKRAGFAVRWAEERRATEI